MLASDVTISWYHHHGDRGGLRKPHSWHRVMLFRQQRPQSIIEEGRPNGHCGLMSEVLPLELEAHLLLVRSHPLVCRFSL